MEIAPVSAAEFLLGDEMTYLCLSTNRPPIFLCQLKGPAVHVKYIVLLFNVKNQNVIFREESLMLNSMSLNFWVKLL